MSINLGNKSIKDIYLGSTKVKEAYLGSVKIYGHNQIFYITVIQPIGGTITATPVKGTNGTEVTLSNSPSSNYEFDSYSVTGATLSGDKFTISNSDVTVTGTFNLCQQSWVDMGSTEYSVSNGNGVWTPLTGMPSESTLNYFTIIFDGYLSPSYNGAADIYLSYSNNGSMWRMRSHFRQPYPGFIAIDEGISGWTTASGAPAVNSFIQDAVSYRSCPSKFINNTYARFKIAFDRPNRLGYLYIDGDLLGYATIKVDPINIQKLGILSEVRSANVVAKIKNIKVSGFSTLERAQKWS